MYRSDRYDPVVHPRSTELELAVVGQGRLIRFVAIARTRAEMYEHLGRYISAEVDVQLYYEQALRVRELLARGSVAAAVQTYFSAVGQRWDNEWLEIRTVQLGGSGGATFSAPAEPLLGSS